MNPATLGLLEAPGALGADIVVGDAQVFGCPPSFGGPSVGFLACRDEHVRQIPGRLVGQTVDADGRICYTLTLQAREQHIRRAKATSNICSNQALSALAATIHLALLGPAGLQRARRDLPAPRPLPALPPLRAAGRPAPGRRPVLPRVRAAAALPGRGLRHGHAGTRSRPRRTSRSPLAWTDREPARYSGRRAHGEPAEQALLVAVTELNRRKPSTSMSKWPPASFPRSAQLRAAWSRCLGPSEPRPAQCRKSEPRPARRRTRPRQENGREPRPPGTAYLRPEHARPPRRRPARPRGPPGRPSRAAARRETARGPPGFARGRRGPGRAPLHPPGPFEPLRRYRASIPWGPAR